MHDGEDNDDIRRANYERMFGTTPEAEAEEREMAARQRQIESERILREAWADKEAREAKAANANPGSPVVTRSHAPVTRAAAVAPSTMTQEWQAYIKRAIQKASLASDEAMAKAIAQSIGRDVIALERRNTELEQRVKDVESELHDMILRARERDGLDEMRARIKQLEDQPFGRPMKVVGG